MSSGADTITALREALAVSPENVPLRQHLADTLLGLGRFAEAEREYRHALSLSPENAAVKTALARAFFQQGKQSEALVLLESLVQSPQSSAVAHLLYAQLLLKTGKKELPAEHYRCAVQLDASLADPELSARIDSAAARIVDPDDADEPAAVAPAAAVFRPAVRLPSTPARSEPVEADIDKPNIRFGDVGGMETVKEEIRLKIIHPLKHPDLYAAYGKKVGGGILMYGPPGCGKTYLARATAGEIDARFISVGISDVLDMWVGSSERNLKALFEQARNNKPCVLFFDEVDALAASRSDMRHSNSRHLINQFLAEMDGIAAANDGVLILAATNAPWHVDAAFRRPGRFDRILFVPPPDAPARAAVLRILTTGKPVKDIDYDAVAAKADAFSGADLKALVDVAIEAKLTDAMKSGVPTPLTTKDLLTAAKTVKPTTREWFASAKNYAMYANQGGAYDDVLKYLKL